MKKMWLMSLAVLCVMVACNKEELSTATEEPSSGKVEQIHEPESSGDRTTCDPFAGFVVDGDLLNFESAEAVEQVLLCLEDAYDAHQDAFEAEYGDLSDEEIELIEEEIGFDDYLPLREFENTLGFASLRSKIEIEEEAWLDNEELDLDNNPDDHFIVDDVTRTIFNESGQLMIAGELVDVNTLAELNGEEGADSRSSTCKTHKSKSAYVNYATNRLMKKKVAIRSYAWGTYVKAKTKSYKKKRRRWRKYRRNICAQADGYLWNAECENQTYFNYPLAKCKKRKSILWRGKFNASRTKKNKIKGYHKVDSHLSTLWLSW